ncbi:MAG: hypothetical protein KME26_09210 [Oscillatoria princeps RMCB-10]|jgi:hypothetical protein|nr:hypothetical protein [Oscillatoria princeps RMCB-10]
MATGQVFPCALTFKLSYRQITISKNGRKICESRTWQKQGVNTWLVRQDNA